MSAAVGVVVRRFDAASGDESREGFLATGAALRSGNVAVTAGDYIDR